MYVANQWLRSYSNIKSDSVLKILWNRDLVFVFVIPPHDCLSLGPIVGVILPTREVVTWKSLDPDREIQEHRLSCNLVLNAHLLSSCISTAWLVAGMATDLQYLGTNHGQGGQIGDSSFTSAHLARRMCKSDRKTARLLPVRDLFYQ